MDSEPGLVQDVAVFDPALCGTIAQSLAILAEGRAQKALFKTGMAAVGDRDFVLNVLDDCAMSEKELAAVERIGMALGQKYERLARWSPEAGAVLIAGAVGSRYVHAMNVLKAEARKRHKAEGEKKEGA